MSSSHQPSKKLTQIKVSPIPLLPNGNDTEVASKLKSLISDANDGLIRIARLGAFIDHIRSKLPHGHFKHWMAAHCSDVSERSVFRWRSICAGILSDAGLSGQKLRALERPLYEVLELPFAELSDSEKSVVSKIRDAAEQTGFKKLESRPVRSKPELSPEAKVAAENRGHFTEWLELVCSMERMLKDDSLGKAISHDPSVSTRMEQVRLAWGERLKVVTRAHKSGKN